MTQMFTDSAYTLAYSFMNYQHEFYLCKSEPSVANKFWLYFFLGNLPNQSHPVDHVSVCGRTGTCPR